MNIKNNRIIEVKEAKPRLENLVYFSIEEENLLLEFEELDKNDPKYVELMHTQQNLREAAQVIEDSLFALSKRVPQVSSKINSGLIWVNSWLIRDLRIPFGGMKQSGVGREGGFDSLVFFTEAKNICVKI